MSPPRPRLPTAPTAEAIAGFSERDFYLAEFRGRTVAIALREADASGLECLQSVVADLVANSTRVVLLSPEGGLLARALGDRVITSGASDWVGSLWCLLREHGCAGVNLGGEGNLATACRRAAERLGFAKLVWIDAVGPAAGDPTGSVSYVDRAALDQMLAASELAPERRALLLEIFGMIEGGLPAVNLCSLEGLERELFSYAGSGTLFTRDGYTRVRDLRLHEFDAAHHLMLRGVTEGYLAPRSPEDQQRVLAHAFGVFVEDRYLAGIGALLPHPGNAPSGEVASLYTVTRILGEGVGRHLIGFARDRARELGWTRLFACTTSETVGAFFLRSGFESAAADSLPDSKWQGYPESRREKLRCFALPIEGEAGEAGGGR